MYFGIFIHCLRASLNQDLWLVKRLIELSNLSVHANIEDFWIKANNEYDNVYKDLLTDMLSNIEQGTERRHGYVQTLIKDCWVNRQEESYDHGVFRIFHIGKHYPGIFDRKNLYGENAYTAATKHEDNYTAVFLLKMLCHLEKIDKDYYEIIGEVCINSFERYVPYVFLLIIIVCHFLCLYLSCNLIMHTYF